MEVFTAEEALAFLAERTGLADPAGAGAVAGELGFLPLALAQAAAVIRGQHLGYGTYLERLRALPVGEYLTREAGQPYPHGVAEAVLLSLEAVRAGDRAGVCGGVMELMAVLSAAGVRRDLLHAAGQAGVLADGGSRRGGGAWWMRRWGGWRSGRCWPSAWTARRSLAHRLVLRVVRDSLARQGRLAAVCRAAAAVLDTRARALAGSLDRLAVRDIPEQVTALVAGRGRAGRCPGELEPVLLRLRLWALYHLNELGDSAAQAIAVGEPLVEDAERLLGPDHPDTLTSRNNLADAYRAAGRYAEAIALHEQTLADRERVLGPDHPDTLTSRNNLAAAYQAAGRTAEAIPLHEQTLAACERVLGPDHPDTLASRNNLAGAYREAGRAAEAIPLHEQTLADRERVLGPDHPEHPGLAEQPRRRLPGGGPDRRGDPAARADPGRPGAGAGPGPPRHPDLAEQPRQRLPGGGPGRRGDPAARADPGRPGAGAGPGPPRHPDLAEQPRRRLPGGGPVRRGDPAARADPGRPASGCWARTTPTP